MNNTFSGKYLSFLKYAGRHSNGARPRSRSGGAPIFSSLAYPPRDLKMFSDDDDELIVAVAEVDFVAARPHYERSIVHCRASKGRVAIENRIRAEKRSRQIGSYSGLFSGKSYVAIFSIFTVLVDHRHIITRCQYTKNVRICSSTLIILISLQL